MKSKLPNIGTTIFTVMSGLAAEHGAINLSQGFPDFDVDEELIGLVHKAMKDGHNQYAPMPGVLKLREQIAAKCEKLYGCRFDPNTEVTVTSGATQAIYTAITAFIHPGDEVIIFEPAYDSYVPAILLSGGIPVHIELTAPDYHINWEKVRKMITPKTRMIIINSPHNPTGSYLSANDMKQLEELTDDKEIIVISDEVYEHILFDGISHESVMKYPRLSQKSFAVFSFGKTYHTTGWKMGYCLATESLMKEFRKVHQFNVFCSNSFIQHALAEYLKNENYLLLPAFYQKKRDLFLDLIRDTRFKIIPAHGSYFQCLDYSELSSEKDTDFAIRLTKEFGIASVPVSAFYKNGSDQKILRFCFAKKEETLNRAAERLQEISRKLSTFQ